MKMIHLSRFVAIAAGLSLLFTSCQKEFGGAEGTDPAPEIAPELKEFGFATRGEATLKVNYNLPGFKALVELYAENPMTEDGKAKREGVQPVYSTYTNGNGQIDKKIFVPAAITKAYLYTERWGLPRCVELTVNGQLFAYDGSISLPREQAATRAPYAYVIGDKQPYSLLGRTDIMSLGRFDLAGYMAYSNFGEPSDYTPGYITNTTSMKGEALSDLAYRAQNYFTTYPGKRTELLKPAEVTNVKVKTAGSIDVVYLAENAAYRNTFGYYYYEAGAAPTESQFQSMRKYVVVPSLEHDLQIKTGNTIRLKYFGKDGAAAASETFPANTMIGWFIISDGWMKTSGTFRRWNTTERNFFFSDDQNANMRFVALHDEKTGAVVLGCEDQPEKLFDREKEDYCDLLFFVKTDDGELNNEGKPEIPEEKPEEPEGNYSVEGIYAFEDVWPTGGDYDMNDVTVRFKRLIQFDKNSKVTTVEENFEFIHRSGAATLDSYFAYQVQNLGTVTLPAGCEIEQETNSIVFSETTKLSSSKSFTVKRTFSGSVDQDLIAKDINPYIMIMSKANNRKEVHLPNFPMTSKADKSLIGSGNEAYFMKKDGEYPFAIEIPKMDFALSREARAIDKTYPRFASWAASFGKADKDWYLDTPKN